LLGAVALLFSVACTHVPMTDAAENIGTLTLEEAESCERIGKTTSSTRAKIWFFPRGKNTVTVELYSLARNTAVKMGGNAVAALGEAKDGEQDFGVYRCDAD
jgi:hypothetical protein